jgi:sec-independent protein translocase protein TatB
MKKQFETAASDIQNTVQREVNEANQAFESSWNTATNGLEPGAMPMMPVEPLAPPPPSYKHPNKKWRLKRGATPVWFKQRQGIRRQAQSGAARVARFRPPRPR